MKPFALGLALLSFFNLGEADAASTRTSSKKVEAKFELVIRPQVVNSKAMEDSKFYHVRVSCTPTAPLPATKKGFFAKEMTSATHIVALTKQGASTTKFPEVGYAVIPVYAVDYSGNVRKQFNNKSCALKGITRGPLFLTTNLYVAQTKAPSELFSWVTSVAKVLQPAMALASPLVPASAAIAASVPITDAMKNHLTQSATGNDDIDVSPLMEGKTHVLTPYSKVVIEISPINKPLIDSGGEKVLKELVSDVKARLADGSALAGNCNTLRSGETLRGLDTKDKAFIIGSAGLEASLGAKRTKACLASLFVFAKNSPTWSFVKDYKLDKSITLGGGDAEFGAPIQPDFNLNRTSIAVDALDSYASGTPSPEDEKDVEASFYKVVRIYDRGRILARSRVTDYEPKALAQMLAEKKFKRFGCVAAATAPGNEGPPGLFLGFRDPGDGKPYLQEHALAFRTLENEDPRIIALEVSYSPELIAKALTNKGFGGKTAHCDWDFTVHLEDPTKKVAETR